MQKVDLRWPYDLPNIQLYRKAITHAQKESEQSLQVESLWYLLTEAVCMGQGHAVQHLRVEQPMRDRAIGMNTTACRSAIRA